MTARAQMVHRCTVWRSVPGGEPDPYGDYAVVPEKHYQHLPCYLWNNVTMATGEVTAADRDYVLHEYRMIVPKQTDVTEADYVQGVTDRRGDAINESRMDIKAVVPRPDHTLLVLQEIT